MEKSYTPINKILLLLLVLTGFCSNLYAQDLVDDLGGGDDELASIPGLVTERIQRISDSKKIFILTNSSQAFTKGDFISLITGNKLTARALVAKDSEGLSGIKILKIYSLERWGKLETGREVQVLRGDDSYFINELKKAQEAKEKGDSEDTTAFDEGEDLFEETDLLEDNLSLEENKNRAIKTDNLIFAYYGYIAGQNTDGSSASYGMFSGSWGYQITDNIWGEATLGQTLIPDYPAGGVDTVMTMYSLKFKYTIAGPFFTYIQPYLGYQVINAESPGAGDGVSGAEAQKELDLVEDLNKNTLIFGVSVLKRLVPGWFARADLGTDTMAVGLGLEF